MKKRKQKQKQNAADDRVVLSEALRILKDKYPWLPSATLRKLVAEGKVPSVRVGETKRAHYFVRIADLEAAISDLTKAA